MYYRNITTCKKYMIYMKYILKICNNNNMQYQTLFIIKD